MNAQELKILFQKAAASSIEKLSLAEIGRLGRSIDQTLKKLDQIQTREALQTVLKSIPAEDQALFNFLRKGEDKKTKDKLEAAKSARQNCSAAAATLRPQLVEIRAAKEEAAIAKLNSRSKEQLDWLCLLANVSDSNGRLIKYSGKNRAAWLGGLGIKVSGFAFAKKKKN